MMTRPTPATREYAIKYNCAITPYAFEHELHVATKTEKRAEDVLDTLEAAVHKREKEQTQRGKQQPIQLLVRMMKREGCIQEITIAICCQSTNTSKLLSTSVRDNESGTSKSNSDQ